MNIVNEDQDNDDDLAKHKNYYMQLNNKAYKAGDNNSTKLKTIAGKRYVFNEDGKMLHGWVNDQADWLIDEDERATVDKDVYYLGNWDNRAMISCWQSINVHDEAEGEDMDYWFYFIPIEKDSTT
ncbi:hypothetical protein [Lacrimispora brassicae]